MIAYEQGDLFKTRIQTLAHGCNTRGVMGAGVARLVATEYPLAESHYRKACHNNTFRLGSAQGVGVAGTGRHDTVFNLGTQEDPGPHATPWGIFLSFANMAEACRRFGIGVVAGRNLDSDAGGHADGVDAESDVGVRETGVEVEAGRACGSLRGLNWKAQVEPAIREALSRASAPIQIVVYDLQPFRERNSA